ncbi:DUF7502 family protein [Halorussus amylolyticus]|uniref:DUF7502 family protein n=1 Tax=Halorussus amylolyticus TaxID=1126242 RepID=UPI001043859D|nr:hypothetical protein [Halorussus amylolyticus]
MSEDATDDRTPPDNRDDVRAALAEIRRETRKAAFVYASLDAACVVLAAYLAVGVTGVPLLDVELAPATFDSLPVPGPDVGALAAVLAGVSAFVAEYVVRTRRPVAEQFEDANPEVREALRTARDAADADRANPMAQALYADVLYRLRNASSLGLLDATRLGVTLVFALALSLAAVQTAVVGVDIGVSTAGSSGGVGDRAVQAESDENRSSVELRNGSEVLGEETNVSAGSENVTASVGSSPGGEGDESANYDRDTDGDGAGVEAERAGFASPERVEDADLVQRYARELDGNSTDD